MRNSKIKTIPNSDLDSVSGGSMAITGDIKSRDGGIRLIDKSRSDIETFSSEYTLVTGRSN